MIFEGLKIALPEDNRTELQKIETKYEGQAVTPMLLGAMNNHLRELEHRDIVELFRSPETFAAMNLVRKYIYIAEDILFNGAGRSNVW